MINLSVFHCAKCGTELLTPQRIPEMTVWYDKASKRLLCSSCFDICTTGNLYKWHGPGTPNTVIRPVHPRLEPRFKFK